MLAIRRKALGDLAARDNTELALELMTIGCGGGAVYSLYASAVSSGGSRVIANIAFVVNGLLALLLRLLVVY
jgi:hypothetical protein